MKTIQDVTVHERNVRVTVQWLDLKDAIVRLAAEHLGQLPMDFNTAVVNLKQCKEGSPEYTVDKWEATVQFSKNLAPNK